MTTWAWCMSRSTVALAMVLGISSSNPAGCRFERQGDGAFLVGGVDDAVERFGGVGADREQADVVDADQVGAHELADRPAGGVVGAVAVHERAERFEARTSGRGSRGRWRRGRGLRGGGSCRCRTGRTRRGSRGGRSTRGWPATAGSGPGSSDTVSSQVSNVLPVGNPAAVRRVLIEEACRPASSSASSARTASAGSQRCALAVANTSGAWRRMCGRRKLSQQLDDLVGRCGGAGGHDAALPKPSQARVPACSEWSSSARRRCPAGWAARIDATSPSAKRP